MRLACIDLDQNNCTVGELAVAGLIHIRDPLYVSPDEPIFEIYGKRLKQKYHMVIVCDDPAHIEAERVAWEEMMLKKYVTADEDYDAEYKKISACKCSGHVIRGIITMENIIKHMLGIQNLVDER